VVDLTTPAAPAAPVSDPTATWKLEYPYCGPVGDVQPAGPDTVMWVWDPVRAKFWISPGFYGGTEGLVQCNKAVEHVAVMTFNPVTGPPRP
jgi:hypothetical protein